MYSNTLMLHLLQLLVVASLSYQLADGEQNPMPELTKDEIEFHNTTTELPVKTTPTPASANVTTATTAAVNVKTTTTPTVTNATSTPAPPVTTPSTPSTTTTSTASTTLSSTTSTTMPPSTNGTTKAPTPIPTTVIPVTTPAVNETTTKIPDPNPTTESHFHSPSFIGGIVLTLGLTAIGFIAFKYYKSSRADKSENYQKLQI